MQRCNTRDNKGIYLWTAGKRSPDTNSKFAWQVTWETETHMGSATYEMQHKYWNIGQPDLFRREEACVNLMAKYGYLWSDEPCNREYCFICENQFDGIP